MGFFMKDIYLVLITLDTGGIITIKDEFKNPVQAITNSLNRLTSNQSGSVTNVEVIKWLDM